MVKQGYFITVEGGEGAGKTSAIEAIMETVRQLGHPVLATREPGGIPIAEQIRAVVLDINNTAMDARTEALLYAAARRQHLAEKVLPALDGGQVVVCDRFIDSSLAYQGHARGLGFDEVLAVNQFAIAGRMPDLTLFLDVSPEVGLSRIEADRGREVNRLDVEAIDFHQRVREGYAMVMERFPDRVVRVNAELSQAEVAEQIRQIVNQTMGNRV